MIVLVIYQDFNPIKTIFKHVFLIEIFKQAIGPLSNRSSAFELKIYHFRTSDQRVKPVHIFYIALVLEY